MMKNDSKTRARRIVTTCVRGAAMAIALAAGSSAVDTASAQAQQLSITRISHSGDLCPSGTVDNADSWIGSSAALLRFNGGFGSTTRFVKKRCRFTFDLAIPVGYQFRSSSIIAAYATKMRSSIGNVRLGYGFGGPYDDDYANFTRSSVGQVTGDLQAWSPCGRGQSVQYVVDLESELGPDDSASPSADARIDFSSIRADFTQVAASQWQRCGS